MYYKLMGHLIWYHRQSSWLIVRDYCSEMDCSYMYVLLTCTCALMYRTTNLHMGGSSQRFVGSAQLSMEAPTKNNGNIMKTLRQYA